MEHLLEDSQFEIIPLKYNFNLTVSKHATSPVQAVFCLNYPNLDKHPIGCNGRE